MPTHAIFAFLACWALALLPITMLAGLSGRTSAGQFDPPRFSEKPREIPNLPWKGWFQKSSWERFLPFQMLLSGILSFVPACEEMHYILSSVWGHKDTGRQFWLNWTLLAVLAVVVIVTVAMSTLWAVQMQLGVEDYRWWWPAFCCGGSSAIPLFGFCVYYYFFESVMHGWLQFSFYFGFMAFACYCLFLMLGAVGFIAALWFVRKMYTVKVE